MRRSIGCRAERIETRPSWGARRSAMSSSPMIFRRLVTAGCMAFGTVASSHDAVDPARTTIRAACGSKWMSDAPSSRRDDLRS